MRVVLPQSIFETAGVYELDGLLRVLVERAHTLIVNPPWEAGDGGCLDLWLGKREREYRWRWQFALQAGSEESVGQTRGTLEVNVIADGNSQWSELSLSLKDATDLLGVPLCLYLENEHSDWSFLKRIANENRRKRLIEAQKDRRVVIRHGGGNTQMEATLTELHLRRRAEDGATCRQAWIDTWRHWVLFDRDAGSEDATKMHPNAKALNTVCERLNVPHHPTGRRTIENYLPEAALRSWADSSRPEHKGRHRQRVHAFLSEDFGSQRRACLHMKDGLKKGLDDDNERLPPPFAELTLSSPPASLLRDGFGDRIADHYSNRSIPDQVFHDVFDQDPEAEAFREQIFTSLFGRL